MTTVAHDPGTAVAPPPARQRTAHIAVVGNPNTGKSTVFNRLTGARQRVGNYPGVTVEKHTGQMRYAGRDYTLIDLPGSYSLAAVSADERVAIDVLSGCIEAEARPQLVVCVVDAANLMRNLFLVSQIADTDLPLVIVLNMFDAAESQGIRIDVDLLSQRLGVPVVPTVATKGQGIDALREAIGQAMAKPQTMKQVDFPPPVGAAVKQLQQAAQQQAGQPIGRAEALRLLFDSHSSIVDRLDWPRHQFDHVAEDAGDALAAAGLQPESAESIIRYGWLGEQLEEVLTHPQQRAKTPSESIDRLLTHRVWGLVVFAAVMYVVFWSIYTAAAPFMDAIDTTFGWLGDVMGSWLAGWPVIQAMVVDGIIGGVGGVVVFLPQILILFFFLALLEDTGYMARAAFLMDKIFSWAQMSGKSFMPLLGSYACAIPGVMGARTIEDPKVRLTTVLIAPLMSCSARLPVYVLLIAAFIEPRYGPSWAAFCLFAMHLVGLIVALPVAVIMNRLVLRVKASPFLLEMPPYRVPMMRDVLWRMWDRGKHFLQRAGTVIFAMTIVIWALSYFPRPAAVADRVEQTFVSSLAFERSITPQQARQLTQSDEAVAAQLGHAIDGAYLESSYLGRMGKAMQPVFAPAGFDWKITVGVVGSFPAREVIIATLGILYDLGDDVDEQSQGLMGAMAASTRPDGSPVFTIPTVLAIMVFFALCMQCAATLATMAKETNWKWALFAFTYMTALAWVGAVAVYQIGSAVI